MDTKLETRKASLTGPGTGAVLCSTLVQNSNSPCRALCEALSQSAAKARPPGNSLVTDHLTYLRRVEPLAICFVVEYLESDNDSAKLYRQDLYTAELARTPRLEQTNNPALASTHE